MIHKFIEKIIDDMPEEMKLAMLAGCELEHKIIEDKVDGLKYKIKTKNKIYIKEQNDGRKILFEIIDGQQKLKAIIN